MKRFEVLTLFPELLEPFMATGLIGKAVEEKLLQVLPVNFRDHGIGRHRKVDDLPYGGGAGMVLRPEPLFGAVRERDKAHARAGRRTRKILLTPQGRPFNQKLARELAGREEVALLICGRYEGFDERIRQGLADEEISLGDFILMGGEIAAMAIIEAVARLLPGVLGNPESTLEESFAGERLEYPQYTRPPEFEGMEVPELLLSGHHGDIARWRAEMAQRRTKSRRPDLVKNRQ